MPLDALEPILHRRTGPLTSELLQSPGEFGLGKLPAELHADATARSICGFCAVGCQLNLHLKDGEATGLTPHPDYPVNTGMACPKGWEALAVLDSDDRATTPLLRRDGKLRPVDWDTAATEFCQRFKDVQARHGKDSVAFLSTGQIATEEMAFLGAFAKFGMGVTHGDGNTRQCMATAVVAYKQSFGFDAPPYTYDDFEHSDVIILVGSNLCIAHPILYQRIVRNRRNPKLIVIDPRRTETAQAASQHVPLRPKGDLPLFYALAHCIIAENRLDRSFIDTDTNGFDAFAEFLADFSPETVADQTGLTPDAIRSLARTVSEPGKRVSWWWTMGVNQSHEGVRTAQAIINLALMTGNIGKPGTGANSITGQSNAMGSRLFSNTTNLLGGHDFTNPAHRDKIAATLGIDESRIPREPSWAYDQIIDGIESGKIRGLWIIATNPAHSWINQDRFHHLREKLDFLVVQDMYHNTETARTADLVLPAAGWGEKSGTFINSERRIGTIKQVRRAPGTALADFRIFQFLAHRWGCADMFRDWTDPEAVFRILQRCSAGQPCDITGIEGYDQLDAEGGIQWPLPAGDPSPLSNQRRLFDDGHFHHPDQRAKFIHHPPTAMPYHTTDEYPLLLLTGRGSSAQWHTQTRTSKSAILQKLHPSGLVLELHPEDAERLKISEGETVAATSPSATIRAIAHITSTVQPGTAFLAMHENTTNRITAPAFDPHSRQPSYKASPIAVRPAQYGS